MVPCPARVLRPASRRHDRQGNGRLLYRPGRHGHALACVYFEEERRCVERSLYHRANGYSYDAVKIFCSKDGKVTKVPYREHVPPDVTACIFWLKNRKPGGVARRTERRAHAGKNHISDKPMTEEEWIKGRRRSTSHRRSEDGADHRALQRRPGRISGDPTASTLIRWRLSR